MGDKFGQLFSKATRPYSIISKQSGVLPDLSHTGFLGVDTIKYSQGTKGSDPFGDTVRHWGIILKPTPLCPIVLNREIKNEIIGAILLAQLDVEEISGIPFPKMNSVFSSLKEIELFTGGEINILPIGTYQNRGAVDDSANRRLFLELEDVNSKKTFCAIIGIYSKDREPICVDWRTISFQDL